MIIVTIFRMTGIPVWAKILRICGMTMLTAITGAMATVTVPTGITAAVIIIPATTNTLQKEEGTRGITGRRIITAMAITGAGRRKVFRGRAI